MSDANRDTPRYRLLLIASALDGTDVSENAVAYDWASQLATRHDVTILTYRKRERESARDQIPGVRFVEWTEWPLLNRARNLNNLMQPYYVGFYVGVRRWLKRALERGEHFDIAHQLTPVAMRYPCPAVGLLDNVVIGPLAGALETPSGFKAEMGSAPLYTRLRALDHWRLEHDPLLRGSMSGASLVLGAAPYVGDMLSHIPALRFEVLSELGVEALPSLSVRERVPGQLRCLYVGRLIRSKGARDAIRALAGVRDMPDITLDVVGDGEDRAACEAESRRLGIDDRISFHGWLAKADVTDLYRKCDAFLFPSFREPTGRVLVEAMSHGLPVIAANYGGPAALIGPDVGIQVECHDPEQFARDLAEAVRSLATEPAVAKELGVAGRRRVAEEFLWSEKIQRLESLYAGVLDG